MIGGTPTPVVMAGEIVVPIELAFGDPLRLISVSRPGNIIEFPDHTTVTLRQKKIVSKTHVNGRRGTIKETAGLDDWFIEISTDFVTNLPGTYDVDLLPRLKRTLLLLRDQGKVTVINRKLNILGIEYMLIEDIEIPDGMYSSQHLKLRGSSDNDYFLDYFQSDDAYAPEADGLA